MELFKLRYFYEVAKLKHVTKAAEELHISQPSLTQAIKSLETELDVPLFKKNGRGVDLTEYGLFLKERLDYLLPKIEEIQEDIESLKGRVNRTVKLNILAASSLIVDMIVEFRKKRPDVIFDFEQKDQTRDCDILITTDGIKELRARPTGKNLYTDAIIKKKWERQEEIYLAVPKDSEFSLSDSISLEEVKDTGFVMFTSARLFGTICTEFCLQAGFKPKILFESDSPIAVQNMISAGQGVAFWPEFSWGKIKNKSVKLLPIYSPKCQRNLVVELMDRQYASSYAEEFYEFLIQKMCHKDRD